MADSEKPAVPWRTQCAIYGAGIFNFSMVPISALVVALYVTEIAHSAALVGIVLGARHFLTMLLSIHGGILMDRLGTRRVMIGFSAVAVVMPLLYPVVPWVYALILLQMVAGLADAMGWMGAQALSGRVMSGNPVYVGRMLFLVRIGSFVGPLLFGFLWGVLGAGTTFFCMAVWSAAGFVSVLMIPSPARDVAPERRAKFGLFDLLPNWSDHRAAFGIVAIPAITLILSVTIARVGGTAIQSSFYVVYLQGLAIEEWLIGFLVGTAGLCASFGTLGSAWFAKRMHPHWAVIGAVAITVLAIAVTPLLGGIFVILFLVIGLRGICLGISQPIEISSLAQALERGAQGKGVGVRTMVNRVAGTFIPPIMGGFAEIAGVENSFLLMGVLLAAIVVCAGFFVHLNPSLGPQRADSRDERE